jgi:Na+-driven multidrug efflux pump
MLLVLSPALIFGWGPLPNLGVAGGGAPVLLSPLARPHFADILRVGATSAIGTVQMDVTVALITGAVGGYAAQAIAGYGIASRLDHLLIPPLFGFGTAAVTSVGVHVGVAILLARSGSHG